MKALLVALAILMALSCSGSAQWLQLQYGPGSASGAPFVNVCSGVNGQTDFSNANGCNLFYYVGVMH